MKIMLHICCGPCAIYPVQDLLKEGYKVKGYYYNPNIHPFQEYARRREGTEEMAQRLDIPLLVAPERW